MAGLNRWRNYQMLLFQVFSNVLWRSHLLQQGWSWLLLAMIVMDPLTWRSSRIPRAMTKGTVFSRVVMCSRFRWLTERNSLLLGVMCYNPRINVHHRKQKFACSKWHDEVGTVYMYSWAWWMLQPCGSITYGLEEFVRCGLWDEEESPTSRLCKSNRARPKKVKPKKVVDVWLVKVSFGRKHAWAPKAFYNPVSPNKRLAEPSEQWGFGRCSCCCVSEWQPLDRQW